MRTIARFSLLLAAALAVGGCDQTSELPHDGPARVCSIAYLKSLCTKPSVRITSPLSICGTVIGNDLYGEFAKTLVIEDATGGISIAVEGSRLSDEFPFGAEVTVFCDGLTLCDYGGKVELGTTPGEYGAGRIPQADLHRFVRRSSGQAQMPQITTYTFPDIAAPQIDRYVCFGEVRFKNPDGRWCATDPETRKPVTTEHLIADPQGRSFTIRVAGSCDYANEPLPKGKGSLIGVIDYFGGKYTLRMTNRMIDFIDSEELPKAYP